MTPLISIIVPIHNTEKYLRKCIDSILRQTYKNIEVVLVDGASTDMSSKICDEYQQKDRRIKVIHKNDLGVTNNRKAGLLACVGEYIAFVDSDDWIEPDMYETLIEIAKIHDVDIVTSGQLGDNNGEVIEKYDCFDEGKYILDEKKSPIWEKLIYSDNDEQGILWGLWNKLFKRKVIIDNYLSMDDRITRSEDIAVWCAAILDSKSIYICHKAFYHYCKHENTSVTSKDSLFFERYNQWFLYLKSKLDASPHGKILESQVDKHFLDELNRGLVFYFPFYNETEYIRYAFPKQDLYKKNSVCRILIYGAGMVGKDFYKQFRYDRNFEIVGWVDQKEYLNNPGVMNPKKIREFQFDYIIIAINDNLRAERIRASLIDLGIEEKKIVWRKPIYSVDYLLGKF